MNKIQLKGILKNIKYSHTIGDVEFNQANLLVKRHDDAEDCLSVKFKKLSNPYKENDEVELVGNVRSYSHLVEDKNKVDIYIFTYFDKPEEEVINRCEIEGSICKVDKLRTTKEGKQCLHFILANSIITDNKKLNSYIPCVLWGELAKDYSDITVGTKIKVIGELHSREYTKKISDTECEIRVAHEIVISEVERYS